MPWIIGKDSFQVPVVNCRPIKVILSSLEAIVLAQSHSYSGQRLYLSSGSVQWPGSGKLVHYVFYIFKLAKCGPSFVTAPPTRSWCQPNSKGLGEIFRRMRLCVPRTQV